MNLQKFLNLRLLDEFLTNNSFPGTGKTAIVEGLAQRIVAHDVPESLQNVKLFSLDMVRVTLTKILFLFFLGRSRGGSFVQGSI